MEGWFEIRSETSEQDFYKLLGCDENSSEEQISTEFKQLARKYHPDKADSEEGKVEAEKVFVKLEKARGILLDKEKRSKYDFWRLGGFKNVISFEKWFDMQNRMHSSMHWTVPEKPVPALTEAEGMDREGEGAGEGAGASTLQPTSLEEFRSGSQRGTQLSSFRNYSD